MKEIELTQGYVAQVDDEDYDYLSQFSWCANVLKKGNGIYVQARAKIKGQNRLLHRIIWEFHHGKIPDGLEIDHINGGRWRGLDCRKDNLRLATRSLNMVNRTKQGGCSTSIYKGVSRVKKNGRWQAYCGRGGKTFYIGTFEREEQAATAYDLAVVERHGIGIHLNFNERAIDYVAFLYSGRQQLAA